jgi:hypothetical protein
MTNFFLKYVLAPIIFIVGHVGNIFGLTVIGRKKLDKIGPVLIYKLLFISDSIYLSIFIIIMNLFISLSLLFMLSDYTV